MVPAVGRLGLETFDRPSTPSAFAERLPELSWMDEKTREAAAGKLQTVYDKIGYPKNWRDYSSVEITPDRYFEAQHDSHESSPADL